ncbi:unnamed protein product [Caenorhabditis nigoni]
MAPITILKKTEYTLPESLLADAPEWFIDIISVRVTNVHAPYIHANEITEMDQIFLGKRDHERWFQYSYSKDKTPLENLQSQFYDGDDYGISLHQIEHIFKLSTEDFEVAKAILKWDILYRVLIQSLHNTRNQHKALKNEVEVQRYGKRIDAVVRQRNISLEILDIIPLTDLKFDLHWFTANGAIDFVKNLVWEVTASDTILKSAALEIPLLTGHCSHTDQQSHLLQMSSRRPFAELNEYSIPDLERRIIVAALHNELDLAEFLNELEPLADDGEVEHNRGDVDDNMDFIDSDSNSTASNDMELERDEGEQQLEVEEDVEDQEEAEKENGEPIC